MAAIAEVEAIVRRYERRRHSVHPERYSAFDPYVMMADQEKDRSIARLLKSSGMSCGIANRRLLEIGCGSGGNLLRFLRIGFRPENIVGNDLLDDRLQTARSILPHSIRLTSGDASELDFSDESFDVVCAFTVFSSILDDAFQHRLAAKAWTLVKGGGGILWYDFVYNNPANPDVRGVPSRRLRELFSAGTFNIKRITLAPPLGRPVSRLWSGCYTLLNCSPFLRSHLLAWIAKPN